MVWFVFPRTNHNSSTSHLMSLHAASAEGVSMVRTPCSRLSRLKLLCLARTRAPSDILDSRSLLVCMHDLSPDSSGLPRVASREKMGKAGTGFDAWSTRSRCPLDLRTERVIRGRHLARCVRNPSRIFLRIARISPVTTSVFGQADRDRSGSFDEVDVPASRAVAIDMPARPSILPLSTPLRRR